MRLKISRTLPTGFRTIRAIKMTKILLRLLLKNQGRKKRKIISLKWTGINRKKRRKI